MLKLPPGMFSQWGHGRKAHVQEARRPGEANFLLAPRDWAGTRSLTWDGLVGNWVGKRKPVSVEVRRWRENSRPILRMLVRVGFSVRGGQTKGRGIGGEVRPAFLLMGIKYGGGRE